MKADAVFISCAKTKAADLKPLPAQDRYISPMFQFARKYAEIHGKRWYILSAAYGILHPNQHIEPYDQTLAAMSPFARQEWATLVTWQFAELDISGDCAILLAGSHYRTGVLPTLSQRFQRVETPLLGLPFGKQLQYLKRHVVH